jgi:hypothetical protein
MLKNVVPKKIKYLSASKPKHSTLFGTLYNQRRRFISTSNTSEWLNKLANKYNLKIIVCIHKPSF